MTARILTQQTDISLFQDFMELMKTDSSTKLLRLAQLHKGSRNPFLEISDSTIYRSQLESEFLRSLGKQLHPIIINNVMTAILILFPEVKDIKKLHIKYLFEYANQNGKDEIFLLKFLVKLIEVSPNDEYIKSVIVELVNKNIIYIIDQIGVIDFFSKGRASLSSRNSCRNKFKVIQSNLSKLDTFSNKKLMREMTKECSTLFGELITIIRNAIETEFESKKIKGLHLSFDDLLRASNTPVYYREFKHNMFTKDGLLLGEIVLILNKFL